MSFLSKFWASGSSPFFTNMKPIYTFFLTLILGCNPAPKHGSGPGDPTLIEADSATIKYNQSLHIADDSITIIGNTYDTLRYDRKTFNEIIDHFPTLPRNPPLRPDIAWSLSGTFKTFTDVNGESKTISFSDEVEQDEFYMLYAYFVSKQYPCANSGKLKTTLEKAYRVLRNVYLSIEGFGTYFTHQYRRIAGYAAFDAYWAKCPPEPGEEPGFQKQKELFLRTLRAELVDLIRYGQYFGTEIPVKTKEVLDDLQELDLLITDYFILRRVQAYRYSYYK